MISKGSKMFPNDFDILSSKVSSRAKYFLGKGSFQPTKKLAKIQHET